MTSSQFDPKQPVQLAPPKDDKIPRLELLQYDGVKSDLIYVGIKGTVFDVTNNIKAYGPGTSYHIFTGKDSSRGLAKSSLKPEDNSFENSYVIDDLTPSELKVLEDWFTFFSKRYNIVGKVVD
ncbi:hypothetical protein DASC09_019040 [Saccharomycopsis crataegensis]|uniref:Cytochrome b5 heme-binding domain-containing protein n=1 Tax=Saccharomycopsis crataegensis TaxID=43959 RepID=A0AAV5QIX3_9ASCO|nr:hypothetical protein DASC09_019040 [Saccharomycopsis crataegensis]